MSNAAREADYQRSSGRLKNFDGCTRWKTIKVNKELLEHWVGTKALYRLLDMQTICPKEAQSMLEDGMSQDQSFHPSRLTETTARS